MFMMSVLIPDPLTTIVVVSKWHGGCASGRCSEVAMAVVTACPDSLLSRWDGSAEGGGWRVTLKSVREGTRHSVAGLSRLSARDSRNLEGGG